MTLGYEEVAEILEIIDASGCDEVVIEIGAMKLVVCRNGSVGRDDAAASEGLSAQPSAPASTASRIQPVAPARASAKAVATEDQFAVTAPMIGTFYSAPSPDAPPFVEVGCVVRKGQPLCLIEVMKLFTTIHAERDGRIVQIGANNGEVVEYEQTLFVVEPLA